LFTQCHKIATILPDLETKKCKKFLKIRVLQLREKVEVLPALSAVFRRCKTARDTI
jgi:hypothetical protein